MSELAKKLNDDLLKNNSNAYYLLSDFGKKLYYL